MQWGDTVFDGQGQLIKTGAGAILWGSAKLTFAMIEGSLIDIQAGTFYGGASGRDDWRNIKADLRVSGTGYQTFTLGVSHLDGSSAWQHQGGTLSLGDANQAGGFSHAGSLQVATGATALLLSADAARLDGRSELATGARLLSVNGMQLGQGAELRGLGDASVEGRFINEGRVNAQSGTLSFLRDVKGTGSYAGQIQFKAGFDPGQDIAVVDFEGGKLSFGDKSVLTLKLGGPAASPYFDQLLHIGQLDFQGTLHLQFDAGFKAQAGAHYTLFDFQSFTGSFSPDRIIVTGLDGQQLDLSRLAQTGQIQLSPVPEPSSYALWLLGLVLMAGVGRRRLQPAGGRA